MGNITKHRFEAGNRDEWLALRNSMTDKVGGSTIGAIVGHSKYSSFLKELEIAVGLRKPDDLSKNEAVRQGHDLEYYVADRFAETSGKKVHNENCIFTNDARPHLKASIDRKIANEASGLECKTVNELVMQKFKHGDFPIGYYDQCCVYLAVTELDRWYLSMIVWGRAQRNFLMTRIKAEADRFAELRAKFGFGTIDESDADFAEWKEKWSWLEAVYFIDDGELDACEERAAHFIDKVQQVNEIMKDRTFDTDNDRVAFLQNAIYQVVDPADIDGSEATADALDELSAPVKDLEVALDPNGEECRNVIELLDERKRIKEQMDGIEERIDWIENHIALMMRDAEKFIVPGWNITYKFGTARRTASVKNVEAYFAAKGMEVPDGIITMSEASRTIRINEKVTKAKKTKAA